MLDDAPLTWVDCPPAPPASAAVRDLAGAAAAALRDGGAVTLAGADGSGRRTAALTLVAALAAPRAYLVPGVPWRAPEALREIARQLGTPSPPGVRPQTLVALARGVLAAAPGGVIVVDARVQADPGLLARIRPPDGWSAVLLAPREIDADTAWGRRLDAPAPAPIVPVTDDDATVLAATAYFDPWEGAPRALVPAVAHLPEDLVAAALDRLLAAGRLRLARDARRVLPTVADFQARPEPTAPAARAMSERFVSAIATWCGRTKTDAEFLLADDRANVMTALSMWQQTSPPGLVAGFARALPMLVDDVMCHEAAKMIMSAERFGDTDTPGLVAQATRRLGDA
ncbi:MAG: hypothetical protein IPL61_02025 [Myxococcales bacterium]|nr:hypothetical protein [Myxococcales bacterium]